MVVEDYQFSVIRESVFREFGKDDTDTDLIAQVNRTINDAQLYIAKARRDWPWRLTEYFHPTSVGINITATVAEGSTVVAAVSPISAGHLRSILVAGDSGNPGVFGYAIGAVDVGLATYVLQSQYLGATEVAGSFKLMEGIDGLPTNFSHMQTLEFVTNMGERTMHYRDPGEFERIKRAGNLVGNNDFVYTIKPDPITVDRVTKYALYYPYINELGTVHGNYYKNLEKLVNDTDVPEVPVDDRLTLLKVAYWFFSETLKENVDRTDRYKAQANEFLQMMMQSYDLGYQPQNMEREDSIDPGFIQGPAGYPRFRNIT